MSSFFSQLQITEIISWIDEAANIASKAFVAKDFEIKTKSDKTKVTSADIAVSKFLREKLSEKFSQIPVICEEGDLRDISNEVFFLIDPIDGTSGFIASDVEFSVNLALVKNNKPIFGIISAPLFSGGKMIFSNHLDQIILRNLSSGEEKILNKPQFDNTQLRIVTSPRSKDKDVLDFVRKIRPDFVHNFSVERISSSIKFLHLMEGNSNLYLHFRRTMEWDTAAGQALVELMGGKVKNLSFNQGEIAIGDDLIYGKSNFENSSFIVFF